MGLGVCAYFRISAAGRGLAAGDSRVRAAACNALQQVLSFLALLVTNAKG